jgi:uncharacterized protein (TIGR02646 family)
VKYIRKRREPPVLRDWRLKQKSSPQNLIYQAIPGETLNEVRDALLLEQGFLCAYSMMRIATRDGGHVEHILAQSKTRGTAWSIRYDNMIYCYPGTEAPRCDFGAHKKDGKAYAAGELVSPLDPTCENRFAFERDGSVSVTNESDAAAKNTVLNLNLDCEALREARKAAIDSLPIFRPSERRLTAKQAESLAIKLLEQDESGRFRAFAVALAQVMRRYVRRQAAKEAALGVR